MLLNDIANGKINPNDPNFSVALKKWLDDNLVTPALTNVTSLYSQGKARRMIVQLIDRLTLESLPAYSKLVPCLEQAGVDLTLILNAYNVAIGDLENGLKAFAQSVPRFNLTVLTSIQLYDEIILNANTYGAVNGETMLNLGWPTQTFSNQIFFDDIHTTGHTNRVFANYVKTWFQH